MKDIIENAWEDKLGQIPLKSNLTSILNEVFAELNSGSIRIAKKINGKWHTYDWIKKAILLTFSTSPNELVEHYNAYDKIPLKFAHWSEQNFQDSKIRIVPGAIVRSGSYIAKNVILMPSFVNVGAYIDSGTMIDTWATVGSCAQIGKNCHISGGAGIGGVLEPINANPVIIEDDVFIGARSEIAEGVIVGKGSVISMGVFINGSTRIYDRATENIIYGYVPPYSVVVPGVLPSSDGKTMTYSAIIVKQVDEKTRSKTSINELLRY